MKVSVSVIIETTKGLVQIKRSQNCRDCKGMWAFPGGEIEEETITECAIREAMEEVGMNIDVKGIGTPITHITETGHWCMIPVFARSSDIPVNAEPHKCDEVKIMPISECVENPGRIWTGVSKENVLDNPTMSNATKAVFEAWYNNKFFDSFIADDEVIADDRK